jgi:hypothetical protein
VTGDGRLEVVAALGYRWVFRDADGKIWNAEIRPGVKTTIFGAQDDGWVASVEEHEVLPDDGGHWSTHDEAYEAVESYIHGQKGTPSDA